MFFGRIYSKGKPFQPSWRSYAGYTGMIALILMAVEFNVLNVFPGNKTGQVLLAVPVFSGHAEAGNTTSASQAVSVMKMSCTTRCDKLAKAWRVWLRSGSLIAGFSPMM